MVVQVGVVVQVGEASARGVVYRRAVSVYATADSVNLPFNSAVLKLQEALSVLLCSCISEIECWYCHSNHCAASVFGTVAQAVL